MSTVRLTAQDAGPSALRERIARFLDSYDYPDHGMRTPDQARPWILERMYSDPRFHAAVTMLTNEMERYAQEWHEGRMAETLKPGQKIMTEAGPVQVEEG